MPTVARTLLPLPLEHLEPHRFEDMVRMLLYDFRPWRQIESTGRPGGDESFDVRAWELVPTVLTVGADSEEFDETPPEIETDRLWLIQCKREKKIGPAMIERYLNDIPVDRRTGIYGVVLAAACDFSLKARDRFRECARRLGFSEAHLWGRGELEDMLFQPKNDHLLFAYFGFSLQTRRRSIKTALRARLATKHKAQKELGRGVLLLVRDATDDRYPILDNDEALSRDEGGRWFVRAVDECCHDGIHINMGRFYAYLDDDGERWDIAETANLESPNPNPWSNETPEERVQSRIHAKESWEALPELNRAFYEEYIVIPYDGILAIDEDGDEIFGGPHIYTVSPDTPSGEFWHQCYRSLILVSSSDQKPVVVDEKRIRRFARLKE